MARRTVKVEIPSGSPEKLLKLAESIIKKYNDDGAASPLAPIDMPKFINKEQVARQKREESEEHDALKQAAMQLSKIALGIAKGQTSTTPDTVYHILLEIRDQLLVTYNGKEEQMEEYGFKVVISTNRGGGPATEGGSGDGTEEAA
jgi:hypothetical protein